MIKRLCLMVGCSVQKASQKIKRQMSLVGQTSCNLVLNLVRLVVRFHPGAPSSRTLLTMCLVIGLCAVVPSYLENVAVPTDAALEEVVHKQVEDVECSVLFEVVDFKKLAYVKQEQEYRAILLYGLKLDMGPVPVEFTPAERRDYAICRSGIGTKLMSQGYTDGDVMRMRSRAELWKVDKDNWLLVEFETEKIE